MLATHPEIAGIVAESHLFDRGVGALFDNHARDDRYEGFLANYVSADQLADLVRDLCDGVLLAMRERVKPEAERVVEKTPLPPEGASEVMAAKLAAYPDATYVQVVRERDAVVRSLLRAPWADVDEAGAAEWWRSSVEAVRETAGQVGPPGAYLEIAYEELAADPVGTVTGLLRDLGLSTRRGGPRAARRGLEGADQQLRPPARARLEDAARAGCRGRGDRARPSPRPAFSARSPAGPASSAAASPSGAPATRSSPSARSSPPAAATPRSSPGSPIPTSGSSCARGAGDLVAEGEPAREQLLALAATIFRRGAVSEGWGGFAAGGTSSSSLAIVYGDGRRADLAFTALVRNGLLERLHVLAAGDPGGRRPAPIELTPGGGAEEEGEEQGDDRGGRRDCRRGCRGDRSIPRAGSASARRRGVLVNTAFRIGLALVGLARNVAFAAFLTPRAVRPVGARADDADHDRLPQADRDRGQVRAAARARPGGGLPEGLLARARLLGDLLRDRGRRDPDLRLRHLRPAGRAAAGPRAVAVAARLRLPVADLGLLPAHGVRPSALPGGDRSRS